MPQRYSAGRPAGRSFTGIPGDVLIARRARSVCIVCGLTELTAKAVKDEVPWVCEGCENSRPTPAKFNRKTERERGIENLDRLLAKED